MVVIVIKVVLSYDSSNSSSSSNSIVMNYEMQLLRLSDFLFCIIIATSKVGSTVQ